MTVAAVAGTVVWHRDRRLWLFAAVGLVTAVLSLGPGHGSWVPWDALQHVPWVGDIVEVRFTLVVTLCVAVLAALAVDHAHSWLGRARHRPWTAGRAGVVGPGGCRAAPDRRRPRARDAAHRPAGGAPPVVRRPGPALPPGQVVLAYPVPFSGLQSSQAWQAVNTMRWAQAGGGGPQGQPSRAGAARAGFVVLSRASLPLGPAPLPTRPNLVAVRQALALWRVTTVVVPDQPGLPVYEQGRSPPMRSGS